MAPSRPTGTYMKKFRLAAMSARPHAVTRELRQEILAAVPIVRLAIALAVKRGGAATADRVVMAAAALHDGEQWVAIHRVDHGPFAHEDVAVDLHRVGGGVAVFVVARVIAEEIDRLLPLEVDQAQHMAARDLAAPVGARRNNLARDHHPRNVFPRRRHGGQSM